MPLTRSQIAILHVARRELALDEDSYRAALLAHGGVSSARDLDYGGFRAVMRHFEACGFRRRTPPPETPPPQDTAIGRRMASPGQIRKIYALWYSLGPSYNRPGKEKQALRAFLTRRFRISHENFLTVEKARSVIEALKRMGSPG